jgi:ABC-type bacteriocin/lantibiotic exporter with double-glycine peptidase domain
VTHDSEAEKPSPEAVGARDKVGSERRNWLNPPRIDIFSRRPRTTPGEAFRVSGESGPEDPSPSAGAPPSAPAEAAPPSSPESEAPAPKPARPMVDSLFRCFLRIAHAFSIPLSDADLRNLVPVPPSGMTPELFVLGMARLGCQARIAPAAAESGPLARLPTPFVTLGAGPEDARAVLEARDGQLQVFEAAGGITVERTAAALGGPARVILVKAPSAIAPLADWRGILRDRVRTVLWILLLASLLVNAFALAMPLFIMTVYNRVIGYAAFDTLNVLVVGMLILIAFEAAMLALRGYLSSHTGARIDALLGSEVMHRLLRLPYATFERTPTGVTMERVRQLDVLRSFLTGQMPMAVVDLAFVFLFIGVLFLIHWAIGLLTLVALPLFVIASFAFHRSQMRLIEQTFAADAAKSTTLAEIATRPLTVKATGLESDMEARWSSRLAVSAYTSFRSNNLGNIVHVVGNLLQQLVQLILIYLAVVLILEGKLSMGGLIGATLLAGRAVAPLRRVASVWHQVQQVRAAFKRIDEIMTEEAETAPRFASAGLRGKGDLRIEDVSFSYRDDQPPVLRNISLAFAPGRIYGITGPSGCGKSTLAKLLVGLYPPKTGRILIDETDVKHVAVPTLRRHIGFVPQELELFSGTVKENIALGSAQKDQPRIETAARLAGAHAFIQGLPKGYDTELNEGGRDLSAGQRQMLCIARALARGSPILLFDEATSALDPDAERHVLGALKALKAQRTAILISHRLAPLEAADVVIVVAQGTIQAMGPPGQVLPALRRQPPLSVIGKP